MAMRATPAPAAIAAAQCAGSCSPADRGREAPRRDAGAEQRLADIDVAQPGDDPLVEQRGFDRRHLAGERCGEISAIEFGFERLRAEPRQERVLFLLPALDVIEQPEAAGIVEADDGAALHGEDDMVVLVERPEACEECPGAPACEGIARIVQSGRSSFFCSRLQK